MNIEIHHRWTNVCIWSGDIEDQGSGAKNLGAAVVAALKSGAILRGANLEGGLKIKTVRVYMGLYRYISMAILSADGTPWVRMGCLWKTVEEWDRIGIRASNVGEFPDDGSERCEERARAFDFVRASALHLVEIDRKEGSR